MKKLPALLTRFPQGFTLIELVVSFSIIAAISTIGIASFVSYSQSQTVQQAENDLTTTINTMKSLSASQVTSYSIDNLSCLNGSFGGYGVAIVPAAPPATNYYYIYIMCSGAKSPIYPPSLSVRRNLPKNTYFDATSVQDLFFPILTGGAAVTGGDSASRNIIIKNTFTPVLPTKTIHIDNGGNIQTQ